MENKDRAKYFKHRKLIAIDPGKNGGIVIYNLQENRVIEAMKMPETPQEILALLKIYSINSVCYIEKVQGIPGNAANAMFNFGRGFGHLEMALLSCRIPTIEVHPQKWQKALSTGTKGKKTTTEWKNKLKSIAQSLYPSLGKITLAISDALLICRYGVLQEK